ncbi:zinc finger CCCH domain-containing protein 14-like protein [Tanacetum coccineum]
MYQWLCFYCDKFVLDYFIVFLDAHLVRDVISCIMYLEGLKLLIQIKRASEMVQQLIVSLTAAAGPHQQQKSFGKPGGGFGGLAGNFKTKLCENFTKGSCTFGDKCHFAHGAEELHSSGV